MIEMETDVGYIVYTALDILYILADTLKGKEVNHEKASDAVPIWSEGIYPD